MLPNILIINGNSSRLPLLDRSVHCIICSPPYYEKRDYQSGSGLGNEETPEEFISNLMDIFDEAHRVLRDDGQLFINIDDSRDGKHRVWRNIPHRLIDRMTRDYIWRFEDEFIWHKPNQIPQSQRCRFTRDYEPVFMLNKSKLAFFDWYGVLEPIKASTVERNRYAHKGRSGVDGYGMWRERKPGEQTGGDLKMRRAVWSINTSPYPGEHYAPFPEALVEPMIRAGSPEKCCSVCGKPYARILERSFDGEYNRKESLKQRKRMEGVMTGGIDKVTLGATQSVSWKFKGWRQDCDCPGSTPARSLVLDIFGGVGTTAMTAQRLGRIGISVDTGFQYCQQTRSRIGLDALDQWETGIIDDDSDVSDLPLFGG